VRGPSDTELIDFNGWTIRLRPTQAHPPRHLLLIHGWTGDENSMWIFARRLPRDYWVVAPRAPFATKPAGFSWRVGAPGTGSWLEPDDLRKSAETLLSMLDSLASEHGLPVKPWNVMGFSQGGALAATLALLFPERVQRLALLAGFVPPEAESLAAARPLRGKHVYVAHGSLDELVDVELGRRAAQVLESAGATLEFCEDEVGHKVSVNCMSGLESFFA
jgi:phospholipase/carboxylesterase